MGRNGLRTAQHLLNEKMKHFSFIDHFAGEAREEVKYWTQEECEAPDKTLATSHRLLWLHYSNSVVVLGHVSLQEDIFSRRGNITRIFSCTNVSNRLCYQ